MCHENFQQNIKQCDHLVQDVNKNDKEYFDAIETIKKDWKKLSHSEIKAKIENIEIMELLISAMQCPGDIRRLALTQTIVKDYLLNLVLKIQGSEIIIIIIIIFN